MSWLKLTEKSLYLMEGEEYLKKTDLRDFEGDQALDIPLDWFQSQGDKVPMVVKIAHTAEATEPALKAVAEQAGKFPGKGLATGILNYMADKGYKIFEGPREYNIVYVEGMNANGSLNNDADNVFNDIRLVIEVIEGLPSVVGGPWLASTEPGRHWVDNPMKPEGAARIQFGQYDAWQVGTHTDHEALIQTGGPVTVHRDADRNGMRTGDKLDTGNFGINQHSGYDNPVSHVGKASAGCLISRTSRDHEEFMTLIKQDRRFEVDPTFIFTSTIIPGDELAKTFLG